MPSPMGCWMRWFRVIAGSDSRPLFLSARPELTRHPSESPSRHGHQTVYATRRHQRVEDDYLLRGHGRFMADAPLPGQTYACFVRSPHACADIKSIDTKAALAIKGVVAVITAADIKAANVGNLSQHPPVAGRGGAKLIMPVRPALAGDRVRHIGEAVAMVIGETLRRRAGRRRGGRGRLRAARSRSIDLREAMKPGAPQVWPEAPGNIAVDWAGLARQSRRDGGQGRRGHEVGRARGARVAGASAHQRRLDGAARRHRELRRGERQLSAARLLAGRARHARLDGRRDGHSATPRSASPPRRSAARSG